MFPGAEMGVEREMIARRLKNRWYVVRSRESEGASDEEEEISDGEEGGGGDGEDMVCSGLSQSASRTGSQSGGARHVRSGPQEGRVMGKRRRLGECATASDGTGRTARQRYHCTKCGAKEEECDEKEGGQFCIRCGFTV